MIPALFQMLGWSVLSLLNGVLATLNFVIPDQIESAFSYLINSTLVFQGVFPVQTLWAVVFTYLTAYILIFAFRIFIMILNVLPGVQLNLRHLRK